MKILFICSLFYPHAGGIETMIRELGEIYIKDGHEVSVLTKKWPKELKDTEIYKGIKIFRVKSAKTVTEFVETINFIKRNENKLKADIIHVIGVRRPLPLLGYILSRYWRVPIILTIAGGEIPDKFDHKPEKVWQSSKEIVEPILLRADLVNALSKDLVKKSKYLIPSLKVKLIYAGFNSGKYKNIQKYKRDFSYILSARRLEYSKGVDITIKAFNKIHKNHPEIKLLIVGEGSEEMKLKKYVHKSRLDEKVIFTGKLSLEEVISLLKSAIMTIVPSRSEGGGLINLEAQATGCPLITSRIGGIPEYAKENYSALMFESEKTDQLSDKIELLLDDKDLRMSLIKNGKIFVKKFDWKYLVKYYYKDYTDLRKKNINYAFTPWSNLSAKLWKTINQ